MPTMAAPTWISKEGTVTSIQDPGQGHQSHQLAVILPPDNGNVYTGVGVGVVSSFLHPEKTATNNKMLSIQTLIFFIAF